TGDPNRGGLALPQCRTSGEGHEKAPHADAARLALHAFTLLMPLEKFMVQLLALLLSKVYDRIQERPITSPHIFLPRIASPHIFLLKFVFLLNFSDPRILLHTTQHLLGDAPTGPAGDGRRKVDVAPFWMAVRFQKLVPLGEKSLGKPSHTPIAIGIFRPIENSEHRRHRDSVDPLPLRNQRRIFLSGELAERVHVGKGLRKGNGHQVKARICGNLREEADRLANHPHQTGKFARFELLQRRGIVEQYMVHLDAQPLKNDRPGQARSTSCWPEADLFAAQILDGFDVGARKDVPLWSGQATDVMNSALALECRPLSAEMLEDVRLHHSDVDAAQIKEDRRD